MFSTDNAIRKRVRPVDSLCAKEGEKGFSLRFLLTQWRRVVVRKDILRAMISGAEMTFRDLTRKTGRCPMLIVRELRYLTAFGLVSRRKDSPCTSGRKAVYYYRINPNVLHFVAPTVQSTPRPN